MASRARPCAARTRLFQLIATPNRALRAPLCPSQLRCLLFDPKNKQNILNLDRPHPGLFSFHGITDAMKYEVSCPCPTHHSFADPFGNILGSECTGATIRPNFFDFSFCISTLFLLSFLISSYSSLLNLLFLPLLILLIGTMLCLHILIFLYFKLFVVL